MSFSLESRSPAETRKIGRTLGAFLKGGDVVALEGELGAGKTTLVKGVAAGLGVVKSGETVLSPTFTLVHEYAGREKIFHMDWYRLKAVKGADALLTNECFFSNAVTLVEWPERGMDLFPEEFLSIKMKHDGHKSRRFEFISHGKEMKKRLNILKKELSAQ